jgi:hypothetical protein
MGIWMLAVVFAAPGSAQSLSSHTSWRPDPTRPAVVQPGDVSFSMLEHAPGAWNYTVTQTRSFLDSQGIVVRIRESLEVRGDGTTEPPFRLAFQSVLGGSAVEQAKWRSFYSGSSGLIHRHAGFQMRDSVQAEFNYRLIDWGTVIRANRTARRVICFPNRGDKGIWALDVDCQTGLPLYRAEYDARGHLLAEVQVTQLTVHGLAVTASTTATWGWKPRLTIQRFATPSEAVGRAGSNAITPSGMVIPAEYVPSLSQLTTDPINGDRSLVLGFTDGVDEFFVVQSFQSIDPFPLQASGPAKSNQPTHVIASYRDASMQVFVFHDRGVTYQVVGSSSLAHRLEGVARGICRQAISRP